MQSTTRPKSLYARWRRRTSAATAAMLAATGLVALTGPSAHAAQPGRTTAYVTDFNGRAVSVVDTATGTVTASVPVAGYTQDVVVSRAGTTVYAATALANTVAAVDTATNTVSATVPLAGIPTALALNAAGTALYVADTTAHAVEVVDTATAAVTANVPMPIAPYGAVVNPSGTAVYVATASAGITKVDTATNTVTAGIPAANTTSVALSPDGDTLYGASPLNSGVHVIDTATGTATAFVGGLGNAQGVAVNSTGTTVYVTDSVNATSSVPGFLYAIDTATNTVTTAASGLSSPNELALHTIPAPEVTGVTPNSGTTAGGTVVTLTGTDLNGATAITFGGTPATGVTCSATSCTATAPAHAAGTIDVRVTTPGGTSSLTPAGEFTYVAPAADVDVDLSAQPHLGILVPYLTYTLTARNTGPDAVTSATVTASLPPGAAATNLPSGCTASPSTVTCTYGAIANGSSVDKQFRVPLHLLSLGQVTVTGTRTASAPSDPNPANDTASATCTVVSVILTTCP
ncbi:IPT/TIG domain-containing protein [Streptomyces sp. GMY02]|uniref:IPT/TIG domain-containing protein n=1 Tax=Streptomyces sp. GMY02 TaxID=1333528 RepID=UPI0020B8F6A7|nr:IPT/TIG domain-containing protein [Streptomyces sp. GMY02]